MRSTDFEKLLTDLQIGSPSESHDEESHDDHENHDHFRTKRSEEDEHEHDDHDHEHEHEDHHGDEAAYTETVRTQTLCDYVFISRLLHHRSYR